MNKGKFFPITYTGQHNGKGGKIHLINGSGDSLCGKGDCGDWTSSYEYKFKGTNVILIYNETGIGYLPFTDDICTNCFKVATNTRKVKI